MPDQCCNRTMTGIVWHSTAGHSGRAASYPSMAFSRKGSLGLWACAPLCYSYKGCTVRCACAVQKV